MNLKKHFNKYWLYYCVPLTIIVLFFIVLKASGVYPFSSTAMSNYDLLAQICPFLEHFFDVIDGKSSLFYSTAIMGGTDVFGTLAYCAVSPFTFIFLLFGKGNVYYATSFVMPLKLSCIALSFIYFARKYFKNVPDYVIFVASLLYAYCGYTFVANTYINWMDFLIYMPFVVSGFIRLVNEKKIRYFAFFYSLVIYTCFSIACFALLLVFIILIGYAFIVKEGKERTEIAAKICLACAACVAAALPIMVPSLSAYLKSGRNTGLFENIGKDLSVQPLYSKITYIVCDVFFVYLSLLYFFKNGIKAKENLFLFVTGIVLLVPVFIDESCNLLNAGSYMSYSLRFGFLNAIYAAYLSLKLLDEVYRATDKKYLTDGESGEQTVTTTDVSENACDTENAKKTSKTVSDAGKKDLKKIIVTTAFFVFAVAVTAGIAVFFTKVANGENIYEAFGEDSNDFASVFAHSIGGLEYYAPVSVAILAVMIFATVIYRLKITDFKKVAFGVAITLTVQIAFSNVFIVSGNLFNPERYEQYDSIVKIINEKYEPDETKRYYRIKDYDDAISNDAAFTTHTNCFSVFSSVVDRTNFTASLFFGYDGNEVNCMKSSGGNFFGDALLGYKYYFIHNDGNSHSSRLRSYNVKLEDTQQKNFAAVENSIVFPNAFTVGSDKLEFGGDALNDYSSLYTFLGGEESLFTSFAVKESDIDYDSAAECYTVSLSGASGGVEGNWYFYADFPDDMQTFYCIGTFDEDSKKVLDGEVDLGYRKARPGYSISIKSDSKAVNKSIIAQNCKILCMNYKAIKKLSEDAWERSADFEIRGNKFKVSATTEGDGEFLFMNYVAIKGFKVTVNGKKVSLKENGLDFILVPLEKGENEVLLEYVSPYPSLSLLGLLVGAFVIILIYLATKKFTKVYDVAEKYIAIAGYVLAVGVFAFFIVYPTSVFLVKLVKLLFV